MRRGEQGDNRKNNGKFRLPRSTKPRALNISHTHRLYVQLYRFVNENNMYKSEKKTRFRNMQRWCFCFSSKYIHPPIPIHNYYITRMQYISGVSHFFLQSFAQRKKKLYFIQTYNIVWEFREI